MPFFVYHGFVNADNHDASEGPIYKLTRCETVEEVLALKAKHDESVYAECGRVIFRVINGTELELVPKKVVTEWELLPGE